MADDEEDTNPLLEFFKNIEQKQPATAQAVRMLSDVFGGISSIPERAIKEASKGIPSQQDDFNPGPFLEAASLALGGGAAGTAGAKAGEAVLGTGPGKILRPDFAKGHKSSNPKTQLQRNQAKNSGRDAEVTPRFKFMDRLGDKVFRERNPNQATPESFARQAEQKGRLADATSEQAGSASAFGKGGPKSPKKALEPEKLNMDGGPLGLKNVVSNAKFRSAQNRKLPGKKLPAKELPEPRSRADTRQSGMEARIESRRKLKAEGQPAAVVDDPALWDTARLTVMEKFPQLKEGTKQFDDRVSDVFKIFTQGGPAKTQQFAKTLKNAPSETMNPNLANATDRAANAKLIEHFGGTANQPGPRVGSLQSGDTAAAIGGEKIAGTGVSKQLKGKAANQPLMKLSPAQVKKLKPLDKLMDEFQKLYPDAPDFP